MRALVTGAGGFVGRHLVGHLTQAGDEVFCAVLSAGDTAPSGRDLSLDITDSRAVRDAFHRLRPEVVYHLAGIAFVPEAENDFDKVLRVNVAGTANIARQCHLLDSGVSLVFVSSAEVYGAVTPAELPIRESTPLRPANNYSLSKRMAELVVERYARAGTSRCAIARPFNHIGPGQDPRFVTSSFALQLAKIAAGASEPVIRVGNLEARRDFSDVRDIVRAYRLLASSAGGVFNLGSGRARSIQEVLDTLIAVSGVDVAIERDPERVRGPEVPELYGSCEKVESLVGWKPEFSFERSLRDVYGYWLEQVEQGLA